MLTGRRVKAVPWYIWLTVGLVPIGLDGFSQLPGLSSGLPDWLLSGEYTIVARNHRSSLWRTTAWYLFPMLEESMRETRTLLGSKMVIADQLSSSGDSKQ